jgi:hypothetical protein
MRTERMVEKILGRLNGSQPAMSSDYRYQATSPVYTPQVMPGFTSFSGIPHIMNCEKIIANDCAGTETRAIMPPIAAQTDVSLQALAENLNRLNGALRRNDELQRQRVMSYEATILSGISHAMVTRSHG